MSLIGSPPVAGSLAQAPLAEWGLLDCSHYFKTSDRVHPILHGANFLVRPLCRTAILVAPGTGKSTLMRLLSGVERPRKGHFLGRRGDVSLLNYSGYLHPSMTGEENVRNISLLANLDPDQVLVNCQAFSLLGDMLRQRVIGYSATAKSALAYALNLQLPSKFLLAEDRLVIGNSQMRHRCMGFLLEALETRGLIFIGSNPRAPKHVCDNYFVLADGRLQACADYSEAVLLYKKSIEDRNPMISEVQNSIDGEVYEQF